MTALQNHQFEILPDAEANDGFVFGIGAAVSVDDGGFDPGEYSWLTQDQQNTRRGINAFGRDVLGAKTWVWDSHVDQDDVNSALETLQNFSFCWSPVDLAIQPGVQTALRYRIGDRDRRIFGRPRRFAAPPSNLILNGYVPVTHDFQTVDSYTYDDVASSENILYSTSSSGGGFILPAILPISTLPSEGTGSSQLSIGGNAKTFPIIRFVGPWTNPVISTDDWTLAWNGSISATDWVEIDCRPWMLTVKNKAGASVVGGLDMRKTYFEDYWFAPQSRPQVSLGGSAPGGSAAAIITWRNAWTSL
jgi:hypothetical protein